MPSYTPTQSRMLAVLQDGLAHHRSELVACLGDEMAGISTLHVHVHLLRNSLREEAKDLSCNRYGGNTYYQLVNTYPSSASE